jgi:CRISPR/Cas system-associated exonuclease Cas4 (RecB family)
MSSGYGGRGSGSFQRRGSSSKKLKHKRRDFHEHRIRLAEGAPPSDFQTVKERTLQSLERLGHQAFLADSGYGLEGWMKSLRFLLEDFETKASLVLTLPGEYLTKKEHVFSSLSNAAEAPDLDAQIAEAEEAERKVLLTLGNRDAAYFGSAFAGLKRQREKLSADLEAERALITSIKSQRRPSRFLERLLGEKPPSTVEYEEKASRLEAELKEVDARTASLVKEEALYTEEKKELAAAKDKLAELEAQKTERLQLIPQREEAVKALADEISRMTPAQP